MNIIKEIQTIHAKLDSLIELNSQKEKEMTDISALEAEVNNALDVVNKSKAVIANLEATINQKKAEVNAAVNQVASAEAAKTAEAQAKVDGLTQKVKTLFAEFKDYVANKEASLVYEAEFIVDKIEGKPVPTDPRAPLPSQPTPGPFPEPIPAIG